MSDASPLSNGHLIQHYRIEKVLGRGGFGVTYLAVDTHLDKRVVIKENFPPEFAERHDNGQVRPADEKDDAFQQLRTNFLNEARMLAQFEHPNIAPVHSYFEANGTAYFVMPFLNGISLKSLVIQRGDEGLSLAEYLSILRPLLDALDTLHEGKAGRARTSVARMAIYHRDIKPDNILIVEEECGEWTPVLIDFGSARDIKAYRDTSEYKKTIKYKSGAFTPPEFTENDRRTIGPSSDLFSVGASLYSSIARDPLYDRSRMDDLRCDPDAVEKFGEDFLELIMDSTELATNDRPQSTDDWRKRLKRVSRFQESQKAGDISVKGAENFSQKIKRFLPWWISGSLVLLLSVLFAVSKIGSPPAETLIAGEEQTFSGIAFHWCPPGTFLMGTPAEELERYSDEVLHEVTITRGFWLAKFECTQEQWNRVAPFNPSYFKESQRPVEQITWNDTQQFLQRLNQNAPPPEGWEFRLPTEAEWEYACRAGTQTAFSVGESMNANQANCNGQIPYGTEKKTPFLQETTKVGSYPANSWGFHDMHGNVEEYCDDWYFLPSGAPQQDPAGPARGSRRIGRGGKWLQPAEGSRSGKRGAYFPEARSHSTGFRVALCRVRSGNSTNPKLGKAVSYDPDHPLAGRTFWVKNSAGMLLDADGYDLGKEGSKVHLWQPTAIGTVEPNQHWKFIATREPHVYEIMNLDHECGIYNLLDGEDTKQSGGRVTLKKDNRNSSGDGEGYVQNQWWKVQKNESGTYVFENLMQGLILLSDEKTMGFDGGNVFLGKLDSQSEGVTWELEEVGGSDRLRLP